jgi:predicted transposase/invertase (TIGR01784 family)
MAEIHSDLIYHVQLDEKDAYLYLLLEHQSTPDTLLPFRRLQYNVALMETHLKQGNKTLPIIISMCVYHGKQSPYPHSMSIFDLFKDKELARQYTFENYHLIDLTVMPNKQLDESELSMPMCALLQCAYKKDMRAEIERLLERGAYLLAIRKYDTFYLEKVLKYADEIAGNQTKEWMSEVVAMHLAVLSPEKREGVMDIFERAEKAGFHKGVLRGIEDGMQQGMQQGIEAGREVEREQVALRMLRLGQPNTLIQQVTSFSLDEIQKLAKKSTQRT